MVVASAERLPCLFAFKTASCWLNGKLLDADVDMFVRQTGCSDIPVLVDVWAPWCGPCRIMAPAFEAAAAILEKDMRLLKLNSEAHRGVAGRLGIRGIPTMLLYAGGREIERVSGAMNTQQIVGWARGQLSKSLPRAQSIIISREREMERRQFLVGAAALPQSV